ACGVKHSSVDYGKTTVADLVALKGEPLEEQIIPVKDSKVLHFSGNEKFQIRDDIVTHGFKDPKGDEKSVLYWKHKFKDCNTSTRKISEPKGHELPEYELKCPEDGVTVIFTEGSDFVSRVIEHEKQ
ncbi:MAG: hypothetical protein ACLGHN_07600, partial [Bacteriovoracia bacterium]